MLTVTYIVWSTALSDHCKGEDTPETMQTSQLHFHGLHSMYGFLLISFPISLFNLYKHMCHYSSYTEDKTELT